MDKHNERNEPTENENKTKREKPKNRIKQGEVSKRNKKRMSTLPRPPLPPLVLVICTKDVSDASLRAGDGATAR